MLCLPVPIDEPCSAKWQDDVIDPLPNQEWNDPTWNDPAEPSKVNPASTLGLAVRQIGCNVYPPCTECDHELPEWEQPCTHVEEGISCYHTWQAPLPLCADVADGVAGVTCTDTPRRITHDNDAL